MSKYKGLFTFDEDNHKYIPIGQADGIIATMGYEPDSKQAKLDEKARKIVRAWAECCCTQVVNHYLCDGNSCFVFTDEDGNDCCLDFTFRIDNLESNADYTVAELCREEEE